MELNELIKKLKNEESYGISEEEIVNLENKINCKFPIEYKEIIKTAACGSCEINDDYIDFWDINDIEYYIDEIEDLDGLIPFASDGCGNSYTLDKNSDNIYIIPMDCLERSYAEKVADSFSEFISNL